MKMSTAIGERGLRKHLEETLAVGEDMYEVLKADINREGPGEVGILLEDDMGFYVQVRKIQGKKISYVRRIH